MRLIDADALIKNIEADMVHIDNQLCRMFMQANISDIQHMPTVEERKTGHWIPMFGHNICDRCGCKISVIPTNFCPNCGSRNEVTE